MITRITYGKVTTTWPISDRVQAEADVDAGRLLEDLVHQGEQQQQRDPEDEVGDHERREEERRRRRLPR